MKNIKTIMRYPDAFTLIYDHTTLKEWEAIPEEDRESLRGLNDYDALDFLVINDDTVLCFDTISGDVSGEPLPLSDFIRETLEYIREEMS